MLRSQFNTFAVQARREAAGTRCSSKDAWERVVNRIAGCRAETRRLFPDDSLRPALLRWFAFCASTSGVEQGFTKAQWALTDRQGRAGGILEWSYTKLAVDSQRDDANVLCKVAQLVWTKCFGVPRLSGTAHRTALVYGGEGRRRTFEGSEASFLRARRAAVAAEVAPSIGDVQGAIDALDVTGWSAGHEKELGFAENKYLDRLAQAAEEGLLTAAEESQELRELAEHKAMALLNGIEQRQRARARQAELAHGGSRPTRAALHGQRAFVDKAVWGQLLPSWALVPAASRWEATVLVANSVKEPRSLTLWAAVLRGSCILSPSVLSAGADVGAGFCIKYRPALSLRRQLYISPGFLASHGGHADLIRQCIANTNPCNWEILEGLEAYREATAQWRQGRSIILALVTNREKRNQACPHVALDVAS